MYEVAVFVAMWVVWPLRTIAYAIGMVTLFKELHDGIAKKHPVAAKVITIICLIIFYALYFVWASFCSTKTNGIFANFP